MQDFVGLLPVPHMTSIEATALNMAPTLGERCVPTDLGPKCYIALGRPEERGLGDSVTRCHLDMSDAINVMLHVPVPPTEAARTTQPWQLPSYQVCTFTTPPQKLAPDKVLPTCAWLKVYKFRMPSLAGVWAHLAAGFFAVYAQPQHYWKPVQCMTVKVCTCTGSWGGLAHMATARPRRTPQVHARQPAPFPRHHDGQRPCRITGLGRPGALAAVHAHRRASAKIARGNRCTALAI